MLAQTFKRGPSTKLGRYCSTFARSMAVPDLSVRHREPSRSNRHGWSCFSAWAVTEGDCNSGHAFDINSFNTCCSMTSCELHANRSVHLSEQHVPPCNSCGVHKRIFLASQIALALTAGVTTQASESVMVLHPVSEQHLTVAAAVPHASCTVALQSESAYLGRLLPMPGQVSTTKLRVSFPNADQPCTRMKLICNGSDAMPCNSASPRPPPEKARTMVRVLPSHNFRAVARAAAVKGGLPLPVSTSTVHGELRASAPSGLLKGRESGSRAFPLDAGHSPMLMGQ
mmetsp:Transcript_92515/g.267098  ORF Transcript_92515/g.267098 Transcript_92515/m.267098 type:complete len:284 (-) Transcript_92515:1705-2556(-)